MNGDGRRSLSPASGGESSVDKDLRLIAEELRAVSSAPQRDSNDKRLHEERLARLRGDRLASMADMAAAFTHEVTQPLTAAANYLSAARRLVGGNPDALAVLDKAETQMIRAGRIIGRLREFVARGEPETVKQSLHALIRGATEIAAPALRRADVNLILRLEAAADLVVADRVEIEQAVVNLIRNAVEAVSGSAQRTVTIATSLANGSIQTDIGETAAGFSALALHDSSELSDDPSLPDDLSIARSIIEVHRGRVSAWRDEGGRMFSFTLPLVEPECGHE